jgi:hypothetical protein
MGLFSRKQSAPTTTVDMDVARRAGEAVNRGDLDEADRISPPRCPGHQRPAGARVRRVPLHQHRGGLMRVLAWLAVVVPSLVVGFVSLYAADSMGLVEPVSLIVAETAALGAFAVLNRLVDNLPAFRTESDS